MPLLYYKDPADGQFKPYIPAGQDADAIMAAHKAEADPHTQYVEKAGDTVTGDLTIDGNLNAWQIDSGGYGLDIRENALIGSGQGNDGTVYVDRISPNNHWQITALADLVLSGNPTEALHAAPKQYVDGQHVNSMIGSETDKSPSVNSVKTHVAQELAKIGQPVEYQATVRQGNVTLTSDWNGFRYVKIGTLVQVDGVFRATNTGQAGQPIEMDLPFAPWLIAGSLRPVAGTAVHSAGGGMYLTINSGTSKVYLRQMGQAGFYTATMSNGTYIMYSFSYLAES